MNTRDRFFAKVDKGTSRSGCWLWTGSTNHPRTSARAYGVFWCEGRDLLAHRVSLMLIGRTIPDGMSVHHQCDVPLCVNPAHLRIGTHRENMADMSRKGRAARADANGTRLYPWRVARGERHSSAKLTTRDVRRIRNLVEVEGASKSSVAARFGVHRTTVRDIVTRRIWRHVA